ncbi:MAG: hypothetical protein HUU15_11540 [Candidatus Brocadiae bacterium]|nr:hypothetical protein [Candidatus Brocadiia bacterium]
MSCREIRLGFSEALDAPPDGEDRLRVESHCAQCGVCGPEWRTLLRLEELMAESPPLPRGFSGRVMAALPPVPSPRREAAPLFVAGLVAACALVALQLAFFSPWIQPVVARLSESFSGLNELAQARVAGMPDAWALTGWVAVGLVVAGALSGATLLRLGRAHR